MIATVLYQDYGSRTTEFVSGDWFDEVKEVDLTNLKHEPDDVRRVIYHIFSSSQEIEFLQTTGSGNSNFAIRITVANFLHGIFHFCVSNYWQHCMQCKAAVFKLLRG